MTPGTPRRPVTLRRRLTRTGLASLLLLLLYVVAPTPIGVRASLVTLLMFLGAILGVAGYLVVLLRIRRGTTRVDPGSLVESLVLGTVASVLVFALIYLRIAQTPGEFAQLHTHVDALYFTLTTMATVGYGDVHAVGQTARAVVTAQLVFNIVLVGAVFRLATDIIKGPAQSQA